MAIGYLQLAVVKKGDEIKKRPGHLRGSVQQWTVKIQDFSSLVGKDRIEKHRLFA